MTREESIERLKMILEEATTDENAVCYVTSDDAGALKMAIKALEQNDFDAYWNSLWKSAYEKGKADAEQTDVSDINDGDLISRQAAKLKVARVTWDDGDSHYDFHDKCVDCLDDVPPVTPQPKIGHWINLEETKYKGQVLPFWNRYGCSKCGGHGEGTFNYCPNCGAKMAESQESEDKLDGDLIDTDKAIEHYEETLEVLKDIDLEVNG